MTKLKNPLFSLGAKNSLGGILSFVKRRGQNIAEKKPEVPDAKTLAQLSWRHMYLKAVALWHGLSTAEQQDWESQASRRHMTGFAWFMSQALKPNPGLYLPLQGGTMSGDIDMDKNRLLKLPAPADSQEALRLSEYTTNIAPYLYNEGARAYHNANQNIPNLTPTVLALNNERYDTDTIHDNITNNSYLTCKTAGKYVIIANIRWNSNPTGYRTIWIRLNGATVLGLTQINAVQTGTLEIILATIYPLAVTDYVEVLAYHNRGSAQTVQIASNYSPDFMMQRIG